VPNGNGALEPLSVATSLPPRWTCSGLLAARLRMYVVSSIFEEFRDRLS